MMQYIKFSLCMCALGILALSSIVGCNDSNTLDEQITPRTETPAQPEPPVTEEQTKMEQTPEPTTPTNPRVNLHTTLGEIVIELNPTAAPITVENFLRYVADGYYDGLIFHRVIPGFMIQGGGLAADMQQKKTHPPIVNEAANGLKNNRGSICMARTADPDSATSQFFINVVDNNRLDYTGPENPGYAVFGIVIEGMDVVDKIAAVPTTSVGRFSDVPVEPVVIQKATVVQ